MYKAARGGAILGLTLSVVAVAAPTPTSQPAPLAGQVEQLLKRLDSDSYAEREAAAEEADQLPPEALPLLEAALRKSGLSPEVRSSLVEVVKKLRQLANTQSQYQATVDWFRAQYAQQYDEVGQKDPAWDEAAHRLLEEAAKVLAAQLLNRHADDAVFEAAAAVRKTQCSDPLVRYLSLRFDRSPQLKPLKDLWPAMKASRYSAHRKASHAAYVVSAAADARRPPVGDRLMVRPYLVAAAELWPTVLEDPSFPTGLAIRQLQALLDDARQSGIDRKDAWAVLDGQLAKSVSEDHLVRLNIRGYHLVRLGNELRNNARTDIESDAATHVVEQAEKILSRCYELYPDDTNAPSTMLWLDSVQSRGLEFFDTWFDRAIKADPHNYGAYYKKLTYLQPESYGTDEQYLAFARQCLASGQFDTRIPLLVVDAHRELQDGEEWASLAPKPYYAQPEVWGDIHTAYEGFLRHYPSATGDRYDYAELAYNAGQFATAAEQYRILAQTPSWSKRNAGLVGLIQLELAARLEPQPRPDYGAKAMARDAVDAADTRRATVDAYEAVGHKNEKWDFAARTALAAAARALSGDPKQTYGENDIVLEMGKSALDAGCADPLVRWVHSNVTDEHVTPEKPTFKSAGYPAALALLDSEYPAFIKLEAFTRSAYTRVHVEKGLDDDDKAEFRAAIAKAAPLLGPALAESQGRPDYIADLGARLLWRVNGVGGDLAATYRRIRDDLAKAGLDAASLDHLQGTYLYEFAFAAHPDQQGRGNRDDRELVEFRKRMAAAETFCQEAWTRSPDRRHLPQLLMRIGRHTHRDRAQLMFWFRQAVLADPYRRGTVESLMATSGTWRDVEATARLAASTHYWHTQLPFALVTYHVNKARQAEADKPLLDLPEVDKISDEDVWADIAEVFESYLAKYPQDSDRRSEYASLACRAGRWTVAMEQFQVLGDRVRPKPFGTQERFEACRSKIASFTPTTQPSQPTE